MSLLSVRQVFDPSCPSGGSWYSCSGSSESGFVGCCTNAPCANGCSDGSLKPASFNPAYYGQFSDQSCPLGSSWYTCAGTNPPFMGCCKSNPCSTGCPAGDLTAGFLSSNPKLAAAFESSSLTAGASKTPSATATRTTGPTSSAESVVPSSAASPQAAHSTSSSGRKSNTAAIVGAAVGGAAAIAIIVFLILFCYRRRAFASRRHMDKFRGPSKNIFSNAPGDQPLEILAGDPKKREYSGISIPVSNLSSDRRAVISKLMY